MKLVSVITFCLLISVASSTQLGTWNIDSNKITVSGISSGAAFATQFHVGYSSLVSGMGSWAGVANTCYRTYALYCTTFADYENANYLIYNTNTISSRIDATSNLANDRVFIMHGTEDIVVDPDAAFIMRDYYNYYLNTPSSQMVLKNDIQSNHALQTTNTGTNCGTLNFDVYIESCNYDSPYEVLNHIIDGGVQVGVASGTYQGTLSTYDQTEFFGFGTYSMDDTGYVYVPPNCADTSNQCLLHIHFHGCLVYADRVGTDYIVQSGFLELADANDIVMLFPQVTSSLVPSNPNGCWDWFGYTNTNPFDLLEYATQDAPQMDRVYKMMKRAAGIP